MKSVVWLFGGLDSLSNFRLVECPMKELLLDRNYHAYMIASTNINRMNQDGCMCLKVADIYQKLMLTNILMVNEFRNRVKLRMMFFLLIVDQKMISRRRAY